MKKIRYTFNGNPKELTYSEANKAIAAKEIDSGEPEIYDDGQPEPVEEPTDSQRITELEEALDMLLSGVTE